MHPIHACLYKMGNILMKMHEATVGERWRVDYDRVHVTSSSNYDSYRYGNHFPDCLLELAKV
jgi:hypothetical protein